MRLELDQSGERLDAAIARLVPELSRSQAQRLLEEGLVTFEGSPLKKNEKSRVDMILDITLPEAAETDLQAQDIPLDIRYEDDDVIVINKPNGLVVHPAPGRFSPTIPERESPQWCRSALTTVPSGCPGAGWTTRPLGLLMTITSSSS